MMKKLSALICLSFVWLVSLQAQDAKTCFKNMPDSLSSILTSVNRADFIDFLDSKMKAEVTNSFGSKSEMTELSSDYAHVKMTPQSTWQMKLLSVNDSTKVICTISTVCAPACDSHINFYTTDWKELPAAPYLSGLPVLTDFIVEAPDSVDIYEYQEVCRKADMPLMKADLSSKDATLTFTFTTPDYMEKEAADKLKPFIRRPITFVWKEGKFILL
ncbi:DUF3256 family protein [uncultured Bacteroides sp.]|uniref:DUF3256 family protein n=1 Tax=uncultured Bacteroides sp. TaxID=162156 RepID=UPI0025F0F6AE|nr:DUF3256 family protein [uncultured Bacteroides sp.]